MARRSKRTRAPTAFGARSGWRNTCKRRANRLRPWATRKPKSQRGNGLPESERRTRASTDSASANAIRLRTLVQVDSRLFFQDGGLSHNAFVLRRARFIAEGTIGRIYDFQLVPEYAGSSVTVLYANLALTLSPAAQLKFGRFKPPIGLELLQSDGSTFFAERSLVTNFLPNRDLGAQLGGNVLDGAVIYTVGVFNGVADGAYTTNADYDNDKDAGGRVFVQPFKSDATSLLQGLGLGVAGSRGTPASTTTR